MTAHKMDALTLELICLLLAALTARADPLTRGAGLVHYPVPGASSQPEPGYGPMNQSSNYGFGPYQTLTRVRITLTRNMSRPSWDRLQAPELSYFGAVGVGSPPKMFNVVFDTGSNEIWLPYYNWFPFANNLHYSEGFSCKESSTCAASKREFTFDYRTTRLSGETYEDMFTLFEDMQKEDAHVLPGTQLSFGQNFLAIEDASDEQFRWKPYDGVIGLAPVAQSSAGTRHILLSLQQEHQRRLMQSMNSPQVPPSPGPYYQGQQYSQPGPYGGPSQGYMQQPQPAQSELVFAFWINPNMNSRHGGELMLGGVDENRFMGDIYFHRITSWFDWQLALGYVQLGGQVISCSNGCNAFLDTGANSLVGPRQDVEQIYQELGAQYNQEAELWLVDCQRVDQYPSLVFRLDDTPYTIYARHYVKMFRYRDSLVCHMAVKPWDKPNWLLGTSFVGAYYTVFDFSNRRVGFATPR